MRRLNHLRWEAPVNETVEARWLLLIHQIPPQPNYLRVKVRRRLQQLGAVAIKQTVYALPKGEQAREDLEWVRAEIVAGGGEAFICGADFLAGVSNDEVEAMFRAARREEYGAIVAQAADVRSSLARGERGPARADAAARLRALRRRLTEVAALDAFGEAARSDAEDALAELEAWMTRTPTTGPPREAAPMSEKRSAYAGRTWVTRQGIKVDRTSSAWMIRRFIDPRARFRFVPGKEHKPAKGEVRFDMFEAEFTHQGDRCTFETLLERFGIADGALAAVGEIVHDLDLKDGKFSRPETAGVGAALEGIVAGTTDDGERLARCSTLWEGLYAHFAGSATAKAPPRRPAAAKRKGSGRARTAVARVALAGLVGLSATLSTAQTPGASLATMFNFDSDKVGAPRSGSRSVAPAAARRAVGSCRRRPMLRARPTSWRRWTPTPRTSGSRSRWRTGRA